MLDCNVTITQAAAFGNFHEEGQQNEKQMLWKFIQDIIIPFHLF